ncbi:MAG: helix-turn-helix domain-containing protein [Acidimicrobiales bacterium]|jgi:excisionase family DNA binding protein
MTQNIQQENLGACSIDMVTPEQAGSVLGVSDDVLLQLINAGRLVAYNLGGNIRVKAADVHAAAAQFTAA